MRRDLVAGVDSSTQSCTVVLRHLDDGAVVAQARSPHPATTPPISEQSPHAWWAALQRALSQLGPHLPRVAAISVGGQGHALVMLSADGEPLRDAKLWNDTEAAPDASGLLKLRGAEDWARQTGSIPSPALTVSKLAWTERVHPGLVARASLILLPADYLVYRIGGRAVTERGGASGTGYFNPFANAWEPELADLAVPGISWSQVLPEIIGSSEAAAMIGPRSGLGPLEGAVVAAGTGDNMAAALGMGIREGDIVISLGTSGTSYGISREPIRDGRGNINGYADAAGAFLPMITTLNAAKVTDAFRRLLGVDVEAFDRLALATPAGAGGVTLVPYLDGERTPNLPDATGVLSGIRSDATQGQVARAAVEGVLCGLLEGGECLRHHGLKDDGRLIVTGGASQSPAYRQVLANLTGRPVWSCELVEAAAAGAAVQAAAALMQRTTAQVARDWAPRLNVVAHPDAQAAAQSGAIRATYRAACGRAANA